MSINVPVPVPGPLSWGTFFESPSHPGLLIEATIAHQQLRHNAKLLKKLPKPHAEAPYSQLARAVDQYLPLLFAIDYALSEQCRQRKEIDMILKQEVTCSCRPSMVVSRLAMKKSHVSIEGLDRIICFVLFLQACAYLNWADALVGGLYGSGRHLISTQERTSVIQRAAQNCQRAAGMLSFALTKASTVITTPSVGDISPDCLNAVRCIATAKYCLLMAYKDDHQLDAVVKERNPNDVDWMVAAPKIPKARALLLSRLCCGAAEYLSDGTGNLGLLATRTRDKVSEGLMRNVRNIRCVAMARACRFTALNREEAGSLGEALAWLLAARDELGIGDVSLLNSGHKLSLNNIKPMWKDKQDKGARNTGVTEGEPDTRSEELVVLSALYQQWTRQNDMMNTQLVPDHRSLSGQLPGGRGLGQVPSWQPPGLDSKALGRLAVLDSDLISRSADASHELASSSDSDDPQDDRSASIPGTFPDQKRFPYV